MFGGEFLDQRKLQLCPTEGERERAVEVERERNPNRKDGGYILSTYKFDAVCQVIPGEDLAHRL